MTDFRVNEERFRTSKMKNVLEHQKTGTPNLTSNSDSRPSLTLKPVKTSFVLHGPCNMEMPKTGDVLFLEHQKQRYTKGFWKKARKYSSQIKTIPI